jgi:hypothetical protein
MVAVHPDPALGWHPTVITQPSAAIQAQQQAEVIAAKLRAQGFKLETSAR